MVLQPTNLHLDSDTAPAMPKRIHPAAHGGCLSVKFAEVAAEIELEVGTPVAWNSALEQYVPWDPNTGLPAGQDEVQTLLIAANIDGGTYKLVWKGQATTALAFNANAAAIDAALEALSNIPAGGVVVAGTNPFTITFAGDLANMPQELIEVDSSLLLDGTDAAGGATVTRTQPGVVGGAVNQVYTITVTGTPTGGTFTITFNGETTDPIAYNASAADVLAAVLALDNVPAGAFTASGGALPGTPVVLTAAGAFLAADLPEMFADGSEFTGGTAPAVAAVSTTEGDSSEGSPAPAGVIVGFVFPNPSTLSEDGETFHTVMFRGTIHRDDIALPTVGSPTASQLDAALRDGLIAKGLIIQGLTDIH